MFQVDLALDRIIMTFVVQLTGALVNVLLGFKIRKGNLTLPKQLISIYFFLVGTPFFLAILLVLTLGFPQSIILYSIISFMVLFSGGFLTLFELVIASPTKKFSTKSKALILLL